MFFLAMSVTSTSPHSSLIIVPPVTNLLVMIVMIVMIVRIVMIKMMRFISKSGEISMIKICVLYLVSVPDTAEDEEEGSACCPSMMQACLSVFKECSVSLLAGDTVAITRVRAEGARNDDLRAMVSLLFLYWWLAFLPAALALMHS